jgi:hypothetical protein
MNENYDPMQSLTEDLSDPTLTEFPILAGGTYEVVCKSAKLVRNDGKISFRGQVSLTEPATQHNSTEPFEVTTPLSLFTGLEPIGKATPEMVKRNIATLVQAAGLATLCEPEQAAQFATMDEVELPQYAGRSFTVKVSVATSKQGNLINNVNPIVTR